MVGANCLISTCFLPRFTNRNKQREFRTLKDLAFFVIFKQCVDIIRVKGTPVDTTQRRQSGSVIIMLFILLSLIGIMSYAFLSNSGTNIHWVTNEKTKADAIGADQCANNIAMAAKQLRARGCSAGMISYNPSGTPMPGAPTDGSCSIFHTQGGRLRPC